MCMLSMSERSAVDTAQLKVCQSKKITTLKSVVLSKVQNLKSVSQIIVAELNQDLCL